MLLRILSDEPFLVNEDFGENPTTVFTAHVFSERFASVYSRRGDEINQLKRNVVPKIIELLHEVYDGVGRYFAFKVDNKASGRVYFEKSLKIGSLIADESSGFLQFIDEVNLKLIVKRISESAVEMMRCEQV